MKFTAATASFALFATTANAFGSFGKSKSAKPIAKVAAKAKPIATTAAFTVDNIPGAVAPFKVFDPLGLATKANEATLKRYREAELTHGRVAMLAAVGFLVGEAVEGSSFLFDAQVSGPAITHLSQVPPLFWTLLVTFIGAAEQARAEIGWKDPKDVRFDQPGALLESYTPGDLGFDPLGLKPSDPKEFAIMQAKELQNGRLAMLAAAGFMAQELVDGKGILEHYVNQFV